LDVWLTGVGKLVGSAATVILSATASSSTANAPSNTVYVTTGRTSSLTIRMLTIATVTQVNPSSSASSGGGGISGGAAAGIVIGILALVAIGVGAFFFIRRRRRLDYKKEWGSSSFGSSPGSLNRPFGIDQRLEPGMVQRRESVGSLADERDYSRKILRVTPPP
jgi:cell wall integrity and stress response component